MLRDSLMTLFFVFVMSVVTQVLKRLQGPLWNRNWVCFFHFIGKVTSLPGCPSSDIRGSPHPAAFLCGTLPPLMTLFFVFVMSVVTQVSPYTQGLRLDRGEGYTLERRVEKLTAEFDSSALQPLPNLQSQTSKPFT